MHKDSSPELTAILGNTQALACMLYPVALSDDHWNPQRDVLVSADMPAPAAAANASSVFQLIAFRDAVHQSMGEGDAECGKLSSPHLQSAALSSPVLQIKRVTPQSCCMGMPCVFAQHQP
jgi:hypothetical protein